MIECSNREDYISRLVGGGSGVVAIVHRSRAASECVDGSAREESDSEDGEERGDQDGCEKTRSAKSDNEESNERGGESAE